MSVRRPLQEASVHRSMFERPSKYRMSDPVVELNVALRPLKARLRGRVV